MNGRMESSSWVLVTPFSGGTISSDGYGLAAFCNICDIFIEYKSTAFFDKLQLYTMQTANAELYWDIFAIFEPHLNHAWFKVFECLRQSRGFYIDLH